MDSAITALHDAQATRYLSAAGLVVLLYDYVLTVHEEVRLVWPAPRSAAKWTFLVNRYFVIAMQLVVAYEMCGFVGDAFSDAVSIARCRRFIFGCGVLAMASVGIANTLILHRVVILWDHRALILKIVIAGLVFGLSAQLIAIVITLLEVIPSASWSSAAGMCILTQSSHIYVVVWACPMLFELLVLVSMILNALDRPRAAHQQLTQALHRDGTSYFLTITVLRIFNLAVSVTAIRRPSQMFLGVFFVWAMTSTILNRSLLSFRHAELKSYEPLLIGRASPFTMPKLGAGNDVWGPQKYLRSHRRRSSEGAWRAQVWEPELGEII
ncbi:hypothetical protein CERSUDRAFT_69651 [Gelatoporia subvermispora B]|uniref:DUF6533 domain-containing protein n=1 Tax=Ceriporiopsis subvermispora (strain B) TaxID=914234 RepID=M2QWT5_CERS8|nr:hypothetical protein CERSUDRAFT_69651 [Gelatoporia subvermispora B]